MRTASIAGFASVAASTYHWSVSQGSITTPERSPYGVWMTRSSTFSSRPSLVEHRLDALARVEPVEADQLGGDQPVGGLDHPRLGIEHVEHVGRP